MKQDKHLFVIPLLAAITNVVFIAALVGPSIYFLLTGAAVGGAEVIGWLVLAIIYFGLAAIATYFNVATVYIVAERLANQPVTLKQSLRFANSRLPVILKWALLTATVGILLRALENFAQKFGQIGQLVVGILTSLLGLAWSISTIFVVPVLVYENKQPFAALKSSVGVLKKTWGESLVKFIGVHLIKSTLTIIAVFAFLIPAIYLFVIQSITAAIIFASLFVLTLITTNIVLSVADHVFNTALYVYATSGVVPTGYQEQQLKEAVKTTKH